MADDANVMAMAQKVQAIANDTLAGVHAAMEREMWSPYAREVVWEAIAAKARRRTRS